MLLRAVFTFLLVSVSANVRSQTVDTFDAIPNSYVASAIPEPNGKILLGGGFSTLNGFARSLVGRVSTDGIVDSFNPSATGFSPSSQVDCFGLQADSKIMLGG